MNVFVLDQNPYEAARLHCDKHVLKMVLEYAQLLSTAHRLLDGKFELLPYHDDEGTHKAIRFWTLPGEVSAVQRIVSIDPKTLDFKVSFRAEPSGRKCYNVTHHNHPCAVWARETDANYFWLFQLLDGCLEEYTVRYGKSHKTRELMEFLKRAPKNIPAGLMTPFPLAMPDEYKVADDPIASYQNYYVGDKVRFARWTNTPVPTWFSSRIEGFDVANFARTR